MVVSTFIITAPVAHVHAAETESETKWTLPVDWTTTDKKDDAGYDLPVKGNWELRTYPVPEAGVTGGDIFKVANKTGSGVPYLASPANEALKGNNNMKSWYLNWGARWSEVGGAFVPCTLDGLACVTTNVHSGPTAVAFTAPADGKYSFKEALTVTNFQSSNGTTLSIAALAMKVSDGVVTVLDNFTSSTTEASADELTGTVVLKKGDVLLFGFYNALDEKPSFVNNATTEKNYYGCYITELVVEKLPFEYIEGLNQWNLPVDWRETDLKNADGWEIPVKGNWELRSYAKAGTAPEDNFKGDKIGVNNTAESTGSPQPFLAGYKYNANMGPAAWYLNHGAKWSEVGGAIKGATYNGTTVVSPNVHNGPVAIAFTAPADGNYSFKEALTVTNFKSSNGTLLSIGALVMKVSGDELTVLDSFVSSTTEASNGVLEDKIALKKGDVLLFGFYNALDENPAFVNNAATENQFYGCYITELVVKQLPDEPVEGINQWTMASNWAKDLDVDSNGWELASKNNGLWRLTSFEDLSDITTMRNNASTAKAESGVGNDKTPYSYIESRNNRALLVNGVAEDWNGWYVNYRYRWQKMAFSSGNNSTFIRVYPGNSYNNPAAVFTAPEDGYYSYTETVKLVLADSVVAVKVLKNGTVLETATPTADGITVSGGVELAKGDLLMFAFVHESGTAPADNNPALELSNVVVALAEAPAAPEFTPVEHTLPMNWMETEKILGWYVAKQGNWHLTSYTNPDDITTSTWKEPTAEFAGAHNVAIEPAPWLENKQLNAGRDTFYINPGARWQGVTIFQSGDHTTNMRVIPSKGTNPSAVFTAPASGTYTFSEKFNGVNYGPGGGAATGSMTDSNGVAIEVIATVRKNGEVLKTFKVTNDNREGLLEGTVDLTKGDVLSFVFTLATDATIANHDSFLYIGETKVTQISEVADEPTDDPDEPIVDPTIKGDVQLPIIFDGTSLKDKLGLVELMGHGANGIYKENMEMAVIENKWYVHDPAGKNGWQGGGPKQNYQWSGTLDGAITHIGGHNNLQDSGSALVFTAPVDGTFKFEAALSSTWFNQTTRKAWSDYIIQKYDGTTYTELVNVNNIDKPDKTVTTFEATVELKKGEQVIIIRKPNATAVTHNVSSEGSATIKITAINHICSDATVEHIEGDLQFCAPGVDDYYKCFCGALYQDADLTKEIVEAKHEWKDGVCVNCKEACKHDATSDDATCNKAAICSICGEEAAPINPNNHDHDGVYVNTGYGTHRFNRTCCNATDIANEACTYGDDNICDKCGYDKTALEAPITAAKDILKAAFENEFKEGANQITVKGPASPLGSDFAPEASAVTIEGFSYDLLNVRFDDEGNVFLRHHFTIPADVSVTVTVNGDAVELENVEDSNLYHIDVPAVAGKYHVADEIVVSDGTNTITYKISVYTYIKVALASGTLTDSQTDVVKALYDLNEAIINPVTPKAPELVAMANQTTKKIQVFDISTGNMNTPVWEYNITVGGVSGFKYRNYGTYGDVILVTVGTNAEIASCDTKEIIWKTTNTPGNSHSLDIMPNGVIAVGGTVGHTVNFYNINGADPTKILYTLPLKDAHAVLWDPEYKVLWVAGEANLWALDVTLNDDGTVTVKKVDDLCVEAPDGSIHDVQPYGGDKDLLLVSTHHYIYTFDKSTCEFTVLLEQDDVKGVGILENGDLVYIYPDGLVELWNSTWINRLDGEGNVAKIESNQGRFYKLRIWNPNYQY